MATKNRSSSSRPTNVVAQARGKGAGTSPRKGGGGAALWENFKSIAGAIAIYLLIKTLLIEAFRIPSGSMIPTLLIGDWLFVNKLRFGPTIPFTSKQLPGYAEPKRGDVVVFVSPYQPDEAARGEDPTPTLVKRLIGVPGDTIYMRQGLVYINGLAQRQGFAAAHVQVDSLAANSSDPLMEWQHRFELTGTRFGAPPRVPTHDNWGPLLVPSAHFFMMGDNRYCSKDSRYWGLVPRQNVRGRPLFVYYSYTPAQESSQCNGDGSDRPVSFITDVRWGRIGHWIR